jgi:hypothetical protein
MIADMRDARGMHMPPTSTVEPPHAHSPMSLEYSRESMYVCMCVCMYVDKYGVFLFVRNQWRAYAYVTIWMEVNRESMYTCIYTHKTMHIYSGVHTLTLRY